MPIVFRRTSVVLPFWLSLCVSAASGIAFDTAFADKGWWPMAFVAIVLQLWSLLGRGLWAALLVGFVGGSLFFGLHIFWLTLYLGPVPWLALAGLQAVFYAIGAVAITLVLNRSGALFRSRGARLALVPLFIAGLWTTREFISNTWPYGGFAWARVSVSQSQGPFADLVTYLGFSGLTFAIVWASAFAFVLVLEGLAWRATLLATATALVALLSVPQWQVPTSGTISVAAVQANANASLKAAIEDGYTPGQFFVQHAELTQQLIGRDDLDLVVWPENSSDLNPIYNASAHVALDQLSDALGAPLIIGTIRQDDNGLLYNSSLLWQYSQGEDSLQDIYDKAHPVPFAEYMPNREFFRMLAPDLVDLVTRDYQFGTRDAVFDVNGVIAGVSICFDIVDDALVTSMVGEQGAQFIVSQTNNADFGYTDESAQQLEITRLRAIETGRATVDVSTVGPSVIMDQYGRDMEALGTWTPGIIDAEVPLSTAITPAVALGAEIQSLLVTIGLAGLIATIIVPGAGFRRQASRDCFPRLVLK